jgi:uncharacterized protein (TIGR00299 family) protein
MIAYFDCFSGISGDMTLGALIDLGVPVPWLVENLVRIPLDGFELSEASLMRHGIRARKARVTVTDHAATRDYSAIKALIANSPLSDRTRARSLAIFEKIAVAEAGIHGCDAAHVHFHEVGGVDALVDVVGTALGLEYLGVEEVAASPLPLGTGFVTCKHGTLPVPAPATLALLKGVPTYGAGIEHELVTPTGAGIITTLAQSFGAMPAMNIRSIGYGAGEIEIAKQPNLLRIILGTSWPAVDNLSEDRVCVVEANIDDMNPELFGFAMERLYLAGALDVLWMPVYMKKNRPGTLVQVLCPAAAQKDVVHCLLTETTSLGVRFYEARRHMLPRKAAEVDTPWGRVAVKQIDNLDGSVRLVPEYEACREVALRHNLPLRVVYDTVLKAC